MVFWRKTQTGGCNSVKSCVNQISEERDLLDKIVWSDEVCFKLSDHVDRQKCVYWADENPHLIIRSELNQSGVKVWGAFSSERYFKTSFL
jgi:hypothetical protein